MVFVCVDVSVVLCCVDVLVATIPDKQTFLPLLGLLENFYSRQAKVYIMAKNQLFHAAALHKLFVLRKEQKKTLTKDEAVM